MRAVQASAFEIIKVFANFGEVMNKLGLRDYKNKLDDWNIYKEAR